jgi:hypothetical protein
MGGGPKDAAAGHAIPTGGGPAGRRGSGLLDGRTQDTVGAAPAPHHFRRGRGMSSPLRHETGCLRVSPWSLATIHPL